MVPLRWKEAELVQEMRMHQEKGFFYQYLLIFQDNPKKSLKKKKKALTWIKSMYRRGSLS